MLIISLLKRIWKNSFLKKSVVENCSSREKKVGSLSRFVQVENESDTATLGIRRASGLKNEERISPQRTQRAQRKTGEEYLGIPP
jgi:hypothetical protein